MKSCAIFLTITLLLFIFVEDGQCRGGRGGGSRGGKSSGARTGRGSAFHSSGGSGSWIGAGISLGILVFINLVILFCWAGGGRKLIECLTWPCRCVQKAKNRICNRPHRSQTRVSSLANRNTNNSQPEPPPPYTVSPPPSYLYSTKNELSANQNALNTQRLKSQPVRTSARKNTQAKVNGGTPRVHKPIKINVKQSTHRHDV